MPPVPFGKYLLLERISVGGMAEVFKAKAFGVEGFEKIIAIKRILPSMAEDADFIQMFIDEAKIAGQLTHAGICQIFELGMHESSHFIAMEYVSGRDLLQIENRFRKLHQKMPPAMACFIASKVCAALDYAHRKKDAQGRSLQIIHRDVSPQNVLVSYDGEVKLIDFGIAKAISRSSRTEAGVLKGKFGYMSPEQVRGLPLDRRSDVFAVGTLLWEMLTGARLFHAESDYATLEKVRNAEVPPPSRTNKEIAPGLEAVILKALSRDVEDRYKWASELQDDLVAQLMSMEPVFTVKHLAQWMREAFDKELTRERQSLEHFKKVGQGGAVTTLPAPAAPPPPVPRGPAQELEEQTSVGAAPSFDDELTAPPRVSGGGAHGFGDEGPTEIYGEVATAAAPAREPRKTPPPLSLPPPRNPDSRPSSRPPGVRPAPVTDPPFIAAEAAPASGREPTPALPLPPQPRTPTPRSRPPSAERGTGSQRVYTPPLQAERERPIAETASIPRVAARPTTTRTVAVRSTLARDMLIGALSAVLVTGLVALAYFLAMRAFDSKQSKPGAAAARTGTIVVSLEDSSSGDVFLNGEPRGTVHRGVPLSLDGLAAGDYEITVKRPGLADCTQKLAVNARLASVLTCRTRLNQPGRLLLHVVTPDATVLVDKQEISGAAASEPLILSPDVTHTIVVKRDGYVTQELSISLKPGLTIERTVELVNQRGAARPAPAAPPDQPAVDDRAGYLLATTTPPARVIVDDKDTGRSTPITKAGRIPLSPGSHIVTFVVGKKKFSSMIVIDPGKDYRLDMALPDN